MRIVLLAALVASGCIHEPQVVHLRRDALPWPLGQPYEDRVDPDQNAVRVIRVELTEAAGLHFSCIGGAQMAIYSSAEAPLYDGPCAEKTLRDLTPGSYFLVGSVSGGRGEISLRADAVPGD